MPKKKVISIENEVSHDFIIIGLTTTLPDYRIAWFINKVLRIKLARKTDFIGAYGHGQKNKTALSCSFFMDEESNPALNFYLFQNTSGEQPLFKDLKAFNYVLFIQYIEFDFDPNVFVEKLSTITQILFPILLKTTQIKDWDQFMEDLELHIIEIKNPKK